MVQLEIFDKQEKDLTSIEKYWQEFNAKYPFVFDVYRVEDGRAWHINTCHAGYNDSEYRTDNRRLFTVCDTIEGFLDVIRNPKAEAGKYQFIKTRLPRNDVNMLEEVLKLD